MPRIVLAVAVTLALAFGASSALSRNADNSMSFADPAGDVPGDGDITQVNVSHDPRGVITFVVRIPSWPMIATGRAVTIQFDSDDSPSRDWMDHEIRMLSGSFAHPGVALFYTRYEGRPFSIGIPLDWATFTWANGFVTVKVDGRLLAVGEYSEEYSTYFPPSLGTPERFRFKVISERWEEMGNPDTFIRIAPVDETDIWSYEVKILRDLILKSFKSPKTVKAGDILTAKMTAVRDDTGELATGKVSCNARIGKKLLVRWNPPLGAGVARPAAACSWKVPKTAKGKVVKGEVTLTVPEGPRGVVEAKKFSVKVK